MIITNQPQCAAAKMPPPRLSMFSEALAALEGNRAAIPFPRWPLSCRRVQARQQSESDAARTFLLVALREERSLTAVSC